METWECITHPSFLWSSFSRCDSPLQHQRAHEDHAALRFTFYDVISAKKGAPAELRSLQSRCLVPGLYATHLERWLTYYPANQVCIVTDTGVYAHVQFIEVCFLGSTFLICTCAKRAWLKQWQLFPYFSI